MGKTTLILLPVTGGGQTNFLARVGMQDKDNIDQKVGSILSLFF